jgi:hypothetical protein
MAWMLRMAARSLAESFAQDVPRRFPSCRVATGRVWSSLRMLVEWPLLSPPVLPVPPLPSVLSFEDSGCFPLPSSYLIGYVAWDGLPPPLLVPLTIQALGFYCSDPDRGCLQLAALHSFGIARPLLNLVPWHSSRSS